MAFKVKIKTEEQLIEGLLKLKEIGALGEKITVGTYIPDSDLTSDILSKNIQVFFENSNDDDNVIGISVGVETYHIIEEYPEIIGKNGVSVSLNTVYDYEHGDIFEKTVSYEDMIEETLKLINR